MSSVAFGQSKLPSCQGTDTATWNMCFGTWTNPDGRKYVGEWKDGTPYGIGTGTRSNGRTYVGEFRDGKYNGQGTITFPDGAKYIGEFKHGGMHGRGTYTFANGNKYVGEYQDGNRDGKGTLTLLSGAKYVGEWKDDEINGLGTYTYANGNQYVGEFKEYEYHGQGTRTYSDGSKYVGEWKNSKRHGLGKMNYADENIKYGQWIDDRFVDSKDTKITLYKNFLKNGGFRPVEIVIPSGIDCEDIKRSTLKKLIFDQLAYDGESIESLCALDNKINRRCLNEDKKIYTEKWREFTSKSKISMSESFIKSVNKNIEICEVDVSISFRFDEVKASRLLLSIDKKSSRKTILSVDAVRWIELSTQSTDILRITIDQFRRMLLLSGEFDARKSSFKSDQMTKKVYLYDTLILEDFHEVHDAANPYFIFNKKLELYYKQ